MRLLDLFCGAGGCSMGYHRAGFEVVGVDVVGQPEYPFEFVRADALRFLDEGGASGFDAIHASPPCKLHTNADALNPATASRLFNPHTDLTPSPTTTEPVVVPATAAPPVVVTEPEPVVPLTTSPPVRSGAVPAAIARYFGTGDLGHQATNVARCESELNPNAVSSTNDHGTFQLHAGSSGFPGGWVETFEQVTGVPFFDGVYDPYLNAQFARWLWDRSGWQPWACRSAA